MKLRDTLAYVFAGAFFIFIFLIIIWTQTGL